MHSLIRRCKHCGVYTLKDVCQRCSEKTFTTIPMRFSIDDRYGRYRRMLRKSQKTEQTERSDSNGR